MRLCITGPSKDYIPLSFAVDFAQLYAYTRERGPWGTDVIEGFVPSTYIHVGREFCLEASMKAGATHVLFLDTDMAFTRETAVMLAMHDVPFVGLNYLMRHPGGRFTAMRGEDRVETTAASTGLEAVDGVGFGCVLMRTEIAKDVPRPWFRHGMNDAGGDIGEDLMFCRRLREAGHTIWIDHDLSKGLGHVGQYTYRASLAAEVPV